MNTENEPSSRPRVAIYDNDNSINDTINDAMRNTTSALSNDDLLLNKKVRDNQSRELIDDGLLMTYTSEEIATHFDLDFIRSPNNETVIFENARYEGVAHIQNQKYGNAYWSYIWTVDFIQANGIEFEFPMRGVLEIKVKRWKHANLSDPMRALEGKCTLVANSRRQIMSIEGNRDKL